MNSLRSALSKFRPKKLAKPTRDNQDKGQITTVHSISAEDLPRIRETATVVSDPQDVSNLRRVLLTTPTDETPSERVYREAYEGVQLWNHHYWTEHNKLFHKQRNDFIKLNATIEEPQLDAERMSVFYRKFLDDNREKHWRYNLEWYRKHFGLLPLDMKARLSRLRVRLYR
ncbi:APOPT family protein Y39B6A.34, mitochondrial [Galendromus occidentalis]|uniref:APOPT family protein Y39B6A.34, mitochondrial n=1 Tax=Galendromus occidentalis TaxID=34638 RepID=A0AAJ6QTT7_9ACAR|nr:APOPT family protein Y39B6A.34, mitochondrial [Galendromus occidentalis]